MNLIWNGKTRFDGNIFSWFHLCSRDIPARRRFQKEEKKNVEKYIFVTYFYFSFDSNTFDGKENKLFAYFIAECEFICPFSLAFLDMRMQQEPQMKFLHIAFFIVTNWTSSVCKWTNSQRGKFIFFFIFDFFMENTQRNTMNNGWSRFDGWTQFLYTQFTRILLEIILKNYNFLEMI